MDNSMRLRALAFFLFHGKVFRPGDQLMPASVEDARKLVARGLAEFSPAKRHDAKPATA